MEDQPKAEEELTLHSFLHKLHVCPACIARWQSNPSSDQKLDEHSSPAAKRLKTEIDQAPKETICPLCLGILQPDSLTFSLDVTPPALTAEALDPANSSAGQAPPLPPTTILTSFSSLSEALEALQQTWKFDSYNIEIKLPAALAVRAQAAWWAAQQALPPEECPKLSSIKDIKEAFRSQITGQLKSIVPDKRLDVNAGMRITLACRLNPQIESEAAFLAPPPPRLSRKQRMANAQRRKAGIEVIDANANEDSAVLWASPGVQSKLAQMSKTDFEVVCPASALELTAPMQRAALVLTPHRSPVYIGGRYTKRRRDVPQSPWIMDGVRKGTSSVTEEITKIVLPGLKADSYSFMASGREDIDVRMLGNGRPFAIEVRNARAALPGREKCKEMEAAVRNSGGGVEIHNLEGLNASAVSILKQGEEEKRKSYAAVCWVPRAVTATDLEVLNSVGKESLTIEQWTPLRVLHRRANLARTREVHEMTAELMPGLPEGYFLLTLTTAAGTYIKEFVHGDRGRTKPSVKELLGCETAECVYLDVMRVELDFQN